MTNIRIKKHEYITGADLCVWFEEGQNRADDEWRMFAAEYTLKFALY